MTAAAKTRGRPDGGFEHLALIYRDKDEFTAPVVAFVRDGLAAGEPTLVVMPGEHLDLIRDRISEHADRVRFLDIESVGRNPGRMIPEVVWPFAAAHPGRRVRVVGEPVWACRNGFEYHACVAQESAVNAVFAGHNAAILCPYDAVGLSDTALADARRTHPLLIDGAQVSTSADYVLPEDLVLRGRVLPEPPTTAATMVYSGDGMLRQVRRFVATHAATAGLSPERIDDLCVAVNELAANTYRHTDGPGRISAWVDADAMVCQVDDQGHISDSTTGRIPRGLDSTGGRGLLMVHRLCDLVCIYSSGDGTRIRVHVNR